MKDILKRVVSEKNWDICLSWYLFYWSITMCVHRRENGIPFSVMWIDFKFCMFLFSYSLINQFMLSFKPFTTTSTTTSILQLSFRVFFSKVTSSVFWMLNCIYCSTKRKSIRKLLKMKLKKKSHTAIPVLNFVAVFSGGGSRWSFLLLSSIFFCKTFYPLVHLLSLYFVIIFW